MADKGEKEKPTEQVPKPIDVPDIEVTEEGASGGARDSDGGKRGFLGSLKGILGKGVGNFKGKRSQSKSPETLRDKTRITRPSPPPTNTAGNILLDFFNPKRGSEEESQNLCEQEVVPHHAKTRPAAAAAAPPPPPEKDMGIGSLSTAAETLADNIDFGDKSSSVSSAPSDSSSLPDDDTDIASDDGERK